MLKILKGQTNHANIIVDGLELSFTDGCRGFVPFKYIPEVNIFELSVPQFSDIMSLKIVLKLAS